MPVFKRCTSISISPVFCINLWAFILLEKIRASSFSVVQQGNEDLLITLNEKTQNSHLYSKGNLRRCIISFSWLLSCVGHCCTTI